VLLPTQRTYRDSIEEVQADPSAAAAMSVPAPRDTIKTMIAKAGIAHDPLLGDGVGTRSTPTSPEDFDMQDYAWVPQRDLPVGCPYPYPYMPVPQADYASGRWLSADYEPSIPLPPPYDTLPWRCGIPAEPKERKGKPELHGITSDDLRAQRERLLKLSSKAMKQRQADLERKYGDYFDAGNHLVKDITSLPADAQLAIHELGFENDYVPHLESLAAQTAAYEQLAGGGLALAAQGSSVAPSAPAGPGGGQPSGGEDGTLPPEGPEPGEEAGAQLDQIAKQLSDLYEARLKATSQEEADRIDSEMKRLGAERAKLTGEEQQGGYSFGTRQVPAPGSIPPGVVAAPRPRGAGGAPPANVKVSSGVEIDCDLPAKPPKRERSPSPGALPGSQPPTGPFAVHSAYGQVFTDCEKAIDAYLKMVNGDLDRVVAGLRRKSGKPVRGLKVIRVPGHPKFLMLVDAETKDPALASQYPAELRDIITKFNNTSLGPDEQAGGMPKDRSDARPEPTRITLTNRNSRYHPLDDSHAWSNAHLTPTQEYASGEVKVNVDAMTAWREVWHDASSLAGGGLANPLNTSLQLFHEIMENSAGQTYHAKWQYGDPLRSGPSPKQRGVQEPKPWELEAVGNGSAAATVNALASASGLPTRLLKQENRTFEPLPAPNQRATDYEMPMDFRMYVDLGPGTGGRVEITTRITHEGLPASTPRIRQLGGGR
jgi:hypothetical protein